MNLADVDQDAIERELIRALQDLYQAEHAALIQWGRWSRDRRGIYPPGVVPNPMWDAAPTSKWQFDAPEPEAEEYRPHIPFVAEKGDRPEDEDYDEKQAVALDERIHGPGGLGEALRSCLEVAYVTRYVQEHRFHRLCSPPCQPETFRDRLAECYAFVSRFI